ncbi:hypothetical protein Avbf_00684 [Armadillidium vulgare]|nr:hypothetical protein Avbf_00684 [Armadillidium vulgare]
MKRFHFHKLRIIFPLIGLLSFFFVLYFCFYKTNELIIKDQKVFQRLIEASVKKNDFYYKYRRPSHLACMHPKVNEESHLVNVVSNDESLICNEEKDWVVVNGYEAVITKEAFKQNGRITCTFTELVRVNDDETKDGRAFTTSETFIFSTSDFFTVSCTAENGKVWKSTLAGIRYDEKLRSKKDWDNVPNDAIKLNVLMLGFDSLSHASFIRTLPHTFKFLKEELRATILNGYNIIGDGTPQALIPILTGMVITEPRQPPQRNPPVEGAESPLTRSKRKRRQYAKLQKIYSKDKAEALKLIIDQQSCVERSYPSQEIRQQWKEYFQNYVHLSNTSSLKCFKGFSPLEVFSLFINEHTTTSRPQRCVESVPPDSSGRVFAEDQPHEGIFTYRLKGFDAQPVNHYMRTFFNFLYPYSNHPNYCFYSAPRHKVFLKYITDFFNVYNEKPKFGFAMHAELSHNDNNLIGIADRDIKASLEELRKKGHLNETILIVFSDHGNRFSAMRSTQEGKQEERLPFFSMYLPQKFKTRYPSAADNVRVNAERLTSPFDIHETLKDLTQFQGAKLGSIPPSRTCKDAFIEPHWCACLTWDPLPTTDDKVLEAANALVHYINSYTAPQRGFCHEIKVLSISSAALLLPNEGLMSFRKTFDYDGFLPDFGDQMSISEEVYQITIQTVPTKEYFYTSNDLPIFEASLTYNTKQDSFSVKIDDISRINMYGDQPHCIMKHHPHLRKFCYCLNTPT